MNSGECCKKSSQCRGSQNLSLPNPLEDGAGAPKALVVVLPNPVDPKLVDGAVAGAPNRPPDGAAVAPNALVVAEEPNAGVVFAVAPNPPVVLPNPPVVLPKPPVAGAGDDPNPPTKPPLAGAGDCPNKDVPPPKPLAGAAAGVPNIPPVAGADAPKGVDVGAPNPPDEGAPLQEN
jgi:hypothetical protein